MEESEDNLSNEETIHSSSPSLEKVKPKKRSLVERELETNLTTRITSPITNSETTSTSRYGRARKLKTDVDTSNVGKLETQIISPKLEKSPNRLITAYKMHASNSPLKSEVPLDGLDNQIENIYNENISLSRFGSEKQKSGSPVKKQAKIYIRKDLIQSREKDETIMLIKNMFSPTKSTQTNCDSNSESNPNFISKKSDLSSVVKTLDFDGNKKKKKDGNDKRMSQSDLFELEAKCEYQVGDLAWARMGTYPFWPSVVTREPSTSMFVKKKLHGRLEKDIIHVTFLGDNGRRSWIMDSMLRKYQGLLEFETTRDQFSSESKRKDPRLYGAFFISEKKLPNWYSSVEEAESLLKEPKRLRIDNLNSILNEPKNKAEPTKSSRISRTNSDVSLSESLYDSLFSEDDCKNSDSESTRSKSKNKSFDVSDVVTACLDSMAAKTGITTIQKQSHMDRWLQKAKSNTPEKPLSKPQGKSEKKGHLNKSKTVPSGRKRYSLRNCNEEYDGNKLPSSNSEHDYSLHVNGHVISDEIDLIDSGSNLSHESGEPGTSIGIISKVENVLGQEISNLSDNVPNSYNNEDTEIEDIIESNDISDNTGPILETFQFENLKDNDSNIQNIESTCVTQEIENCEESNTEIERQVCEMPILHSNRLTDNTDESILNNDQMDCDETFIHVKEFTKNQDKLEEDSVKLNAQSEDTAMDIDLCGNVEILSDVENTRNDKNKYCADENEGQDLEQVETKNYGDEPTEGNLSIECRPKEQSGRIPTSLQGNEIISNRDSSHNQENNEPVDDDVSQESNENIEPIQFNSDAGVSFLHQVKETDNIGTSSFLENDKDACSDSNESIIDSEPSNLSQVISLPNGQIEDSETIGNSGFLPNGHLSPVYDEGDETHINKSSDTNEALVDSTLLLPLINGIDSSEFLKYVERKQDDLIDEHPELSPEEITNYLYKTWQYEEGLKTDRKKTDDIQLSHIVKGLRNDTPPAVAKGRKRILQLKPAKGKQTYRQTLLNFDAVSSKKEAEQDKGHGDQNDPVEKLIKLGYDDEIMDNDEESSLKHVNKVIDGVSQSGDNPTIGDDLFQSDRRSNGPERTSPDNMAIKKDEKLRECGDCEVLERNQSDKNSNNIDSTKECNTNNFKGNSNNEEVTQSNCNMDLGTESESRNENHELDKEIASVDGDKDYDDYKAGDIDSMSDSDVSGIASGAISPLSFDGNPKRNLLNDDLDRFSLNSESSEVSLSKRKLRKGNPESKPRHDNPEFLKYLEFRRDALMDEHPELSPEEITSYLFNTWIYEESLKTDRKKTDDIDQANLVKGLHQEVTVPAKRARKKKEKYAFSKAEEVQSKDKSKRRTERQFYKEDFSDFEDEIEYFDIFDIKGKKSSSRDPSSSKEAKVEDKNNIVGGSGGEEVAGESIDDADQFDQVEEYFHQLTHPKPNLFKGLIREKVCQVCEKVGSLVKCKGCCGMFHMDCVSRVEEVTDSPQPTKGRKKKQKKRGRKPKGFDDSNDDHSDDRNDHNNSEDKEYEMESRTVANAEEFEEKLSAKLREVLENAKYDSYSSDEELDWSDTDIGKCKVVDIVPKQKKIEAKNFPDFKCSNCEKHTTPVCFVCKRVKSPRKQVEYRQKCQVAHCNQFYHLECLEHWPQTQFNSGESSRSKKSSEVFEALTCPRHVCHTCVCDDPRGCKTRFSGDKLARCIRCPATYHTFTKCLPAGSQILTGSHIICPRHYENKPGKVPCHVNTGWCFICALGGTLICCEYCPTSFHAECLNIKPPEDGYMCEDCETGCLPLYGEIVWVKLGHYRWWPGLILHPSEIPENIQAVKHYQGEFVVRFFGQYDHYWVNRGRVFPFQEGDTGKISSKNSKIDAAFSLAVEHAQRAYDIIKAAAPANEGDAEIASSLLPPHFVKLKVNRPLGALAGRRAEPEHSLTQCECDPDAPQPCGPYSHCLNRMLLTECGPSCRAGERCCNRAFERRLYPRLAPARTAARGWGLSTLDPIPAGQFVIEYVGELIDMEEFQRRMKRKHEVRDENYYFLTLDKERMIDAGPKGNLARFMNHSCDPNCETQKWTVLGDVRVGLFALCDIPANSELTFNYNLECAGIEKKRCMCGTKRCSGFMGAKPKQDESQSKKNKIAAKRTYKKRKPIPIELSPSTSQKTKRGRPKNRELTEIEKDLLIIKSATNGISSDSESSGRLNSIDSVNSLKRKRLYEETNYDLSSPSSKRSKLDKNYDGD